MAQKSSHAILRMVFQFSLSQPLSAIFSKADLSKKLDFEIGISPFVESELSRFEKVFTLLLETRDTDFDSNDILMEIKKGITMDNDLPLPNVMILESGDNPNNNDDMQNAALMYLKDIGLETSGFISLVTDQAIYRRLYELYEAHQEFRFILGS